MRIPIIVVSRVKKACGSFRNSESTSSDSESQPLFPSDIQIQNRENPYCCLFLIFLLLMFIVGSVVGAGIFFLNSDGKNKSLIFSIVVSLLNIHACLYNGLVILTILLGFKELNYFSVQFFA